MVANPFDTDNYLTTEPDSIVVGSFVGWQRLIALDGDLYALRYDLVPRSGGPTLTVTGTQVGAYWRFEIPTSVSDAWENPAGAYRMSLIVERLADSETAEVESSHVTIYASTEDRRTHAEVMVGKINSILEGRADHDIESYTIKSRSISRMSVSELTRWRDYYLDEIARTGGSEKKKGAAKSNTLRVRFTQ